MGLDRIKERFPELRGVEVPTYFVDLKSLSDRAQFLRENFNGFIAYALKANPDPVMLRTIAPYIDGVDCASHVEVEIVRNLIQTNLHKILFNNPKFPLGLPAIKVVHGFGVRHFTVDNLEDLSLLFDNFDVEDLEIVVRIASLKNKNAGVDFSLGPGADLEIAKSIILKAKRRGVSKIGVSFHVGSQNSDISLYYDYLNLISRLEAETGVKFSIINLGGGLPVKIFDKDLSTEEFFEKFQIFMENVDSKFPNAQHVIEPGRAMVAEATVLVNPVTRVVDRGDFIEVRIPDGPFFSYMDYKFHRWAYPFEHYDSNFDPIMKKDSTVPIRLVGPTCDPADYIDGVGVSSSIKTGDYIVSKCAGAYMRSQRTTFNFGYDCSSSLKCFDVSYYT